MRTRAILFAAAAALTLTAGCSATTEPMACAGNPKCKADTRPGPPRNLQPLQVSPAPGLGT